MRRTSNLRVWGPLFLGWLGRYKTDGRADRAGKLRQGRLRFRGARGTKVLKVLLKASVRMTNSLRSNSVILTDNAKSSEPKSLSTPANAVCPAAVSPPSPLFLCVGCYTLSEHFTQKRGTGCESYLLTECGTNIPQRWGCRSRE